MKKALTFVSALYCLAGYAQEGVSIRGVVVSGKPVNEHREVEGIEFDSLEVPGGNEGLKKLLEPLTLGKPITKELLQEIKRQIILYYRKQNRPVVTVLIPEQEITHGTIEIIVLEAKLGKVKCRGNRWYSSRLLQSYVDIDPGEAISDDTLLTDVSWMNRNPFRRTDILFTPGEEFGTTDIELVTKDRFPLRPYGGGDNTGNDATGNERWYAGMTWGNAFWCDSLLSYQYTTSSDFHQYQAHTFNFSAPLKWRHILILFGGYSTIDPDFKKIDKNIRSHGHSAQASLRYEIPYGKNYNSNLKEFLFGFDFKNTNNNLEFVGDNTIPIITRTVNISQLVAGFNWGKETEHNRFVSSAEVFYSPGKIFPDQSNADFNNLRAGAKNRYVYGRASLGDVYQLPKKFSLSLLTRAQLASQNLLPSEQFGIGGYNTVRGYNEREVNTDNAFILNFETRSPPLHLFKKANDDLIFLTFLDFGYGYDHKRLPDAQKSQSLLGVGPGLRYAIDHYFSLRVDWGFKLLKTQFNEQPISKVHFGFILSY